MPIDASIYDTKRPAAQNPLEMVAQAVNIAGAVNKNTHQLGENKLQAGKIAVGDAIRRNTDPDTGLVNTSGLLADVNRNPLTATQYQPTADYVTSLNKGVPTVDAEGRPTIVPTQGANAALNPSNYSQEHSQEQVEGAHDYLQDIQDTGNELLKKPDLSYNDLIKTGTDLIGKGRATPQGVLASLSGLPVDAKPDQIRAHVQQHLDETNGIRDAITQQYGPRSKPALQDLPSLPTGMPVGYDEKVKASQSRIQQVRNEATAAPAKANNWYNIINLSKNGLQTGPTASFWGDVKSWLADNGLATAKGESDAEALQEAKKYFSNAVQQRGGGEGTNKQLEALQTASPTDKNLPKVVQDLTYNLLAQDLSPKFKQNAMNKAIGNGLDPNKEEQFKRSWDNNYDPRAVQLTLLPTAKEQEDFLRGLQKDQREKVYKNFKALRAMGAFEE